MAFGKLRANVYEGKIMKVSRIHQIEITSRCNLKCRYCVHPKMGRPKIDMSMDIFNTAVRKAKQCVEYHGQVELNLAGIGESTMHPDFIDMVGIARSMVGWDTLITITTNGVALTEDMVKGLVKYRPTIFVSMHRPEKAGPAIELLKRYNMLQGVSADPSIAAIDWAGQVEWHVSCRKDIPCPWLTNGQVMVMADGNVTTCCLDGEGDGIIGHITDDMATWEVKPYSLCKDCHHIVPATSINQNYSQKVIAL